MVTAIILAGGVGARLGKGIPKQFVRVLGKPIIAYTLEKFQDNPYIDAIEIVCHGDYIAKCQDIAREYGITKAKWFVGGGASYPESTVKGLFYLKDKLSGDDIVVVHGSCAPLVTDEVIDDAIRVCREHGAAMPIQPIYLSTVAKNNDEYTAEPVDRERVVQVQFPLVFRFGYIIDTYDSVINSGKFAELGLHLQYAVFANGGKMYFSKGDDRNFKITTQADLDFFEGYLMLIEKRKREDK